MRHKSKTRFTIDLRMTVWLIFFVVITGFEALNYIMPMLANIWKYASVLMVVWIIYRLLQNPRINKLTIAGCAFLAVPVISSLLNGTDMVLRSAYQFYLCALMIIGIDCMIKHIGIQKSMYVLTSLFEILLYINLISMIFYPNGLIRIILQGGGDKWIALTRGFQRTSSVRVGWMLGHQGLLTIYAVPAVCCTLLRSALAGNKKVDLRAWILILACAVEVYHFSGSANCIITYTLFLLIVFLTPIIKTMRLPSVKWMLLALLLLFFFVCVFQVHQYLSFLIVTVLKRDLSLTGRIQVWREALNVISQKPLLGYGYLPSTEGFKLLKMASHPHNQFLFIAYQGGMAALLPLLYYIVKTTQNLLKERKKSSAIIIWGAVVCILIGMLGDRYIPYYNVVLIVFSLASHIQLLQKVIEE